MAKSELFMLREVFPGFVLAWEGLTQVQFLSWSLDNPGYKSVLFNKQGTFVS